MSVQGLAGTFDMRRPFRPRQFLLAAGFLSVLAAAVVSLIDRDQAAAPGQLGVMVGLGISGSLILKGASAHKDRERLAWRLVGAGLLVASIAAFGLGVLQQFRPVPAFGPHDLLFMVSYLTALTGFAIMPQMGAMLRSRVKVMLDSMIGALSIVVLAWVFFYSTLVEKLGTATVWERFAFVAYPILDSLMIVVALVVTIRRSTWRFDTRIVLFGVGLVIQAVGDLALLGSGVGETFEGAQPNFIVFLVAVLFYLATAGLMGSQRRAHEFADRRQPLWAILTPYGAAFAVMTIIVVRVRAAHLDGDDQLLLLGGALLIGLVVARQAVALREYRGVIGQQRSALVSSVSHELRTPLTAMVGFLDFLKDPSAKIDPAERIELTDVVHQQAIYMSRIVADLLLLARDDSSLHLKESEVNLSVLVADTLRSLQGTQAVLEAEIEPDLVGLLDADRLRQVLENLVVNANRYGRGTVLVRAVSDGPDFVLEVHDNGNGVPRKFELAIWEQFERGAHRLNSAVPGSGIGLAVVKRIVRRHGGSATYERSKRLGGSCFRIVMVGRLRPSAAVPDVVVTAPQPSDEDHPHYRQVSA